jgi:ABC-type branched-subunit amino acid transport system permease subunit
MDKIIRRLVGLLRRLRRLHADLDAQDVGGRLQLGLALSTVLLSITLITGMAGQLSLCQATLAGVGAFTSAQLAIHLGLNMLVGGLVGAVLAAAVAVVLALLSLRLRGLGLALMTLAAALLFDNTFFNDASITGGASGPEPAGEVAGHVGLLQLQRPRPLPPEPRVLAVCV